MGARKMPQCARLNPSNGNLAESASGGENGQLNEAGSLSGPFTNMPTTRKAT